MQKYNEFGEELDEDGLLTEIEDFPVPEDYVLDDPTGESYDPIDSSILFPRTIANTLFKGLIGTSVKSRKNYVLSGALIADGINVAVQGNTVGDQTLKTYTFQPNELHQNACLRITMQGDYDMVDVAANASITFKVGSTTYHTIAIPTGVLADKPWSFVWTMILASIGSSGTMESYISGKLNNVNNDSRSAVQTFDTTASQAITLNIAWSSAGVADGFNITQWLVEIIY